MKLFIIVLPGWVLIRKQSLIARYALARPELSHKAAIEEWKLHMTALHFNTFSGGRSSQGFALRLIYSENGPH